MDGSGRYTCFSLSCIASGFLALVLLPLAVRLPLCIASRVYLSATPPAKVLLFPLLYSLMLANDIVSGPLSFAALGLLRLRVAWWRRLGWLVALINAAIVSGVVSLTLVSLEFVVDFRLLGLTGFLARVVELSGLAFAAFSSTGFLLAAKPLSARLAVGAFVVVPSSLLAFLTMILLSGLGGVWCPLPLRGPAALALSAQSSFSLDWFAARSVMLLVAWRLFGVLLRT